MLVTTPSISYQFSASDSIYLSDYLAFASEPDFQKSAYKESIVLGSREHVLMTDDQLNFWINRIEKLKALWELLTEDQSYIAINRDLFNDHIDDVIKNLEKLISET